MKYLLNRALAVLLGSLLILGCSGDDSSDILNLDDNDSPFVQIGASIDFISATPETIALKGTGGPPRSETSVLVFKVVDEYGDPLEGETVEFELSTEVGGLSLSDSSAVSGSEGLVQTTVNAGNVSTHVRVHATITDSYPLITVVSDELLVSTGLPDQNSISLGIETFNPEAWYYNNVEVPVIFQAADHFNNFVPDGTVVYFTTEGGSIDDSGTTTDGVCEVTWRSGNPRPDDGGVTILAFCIGEESFVDYNGNGFFDEEDLFDLATDMGEPFRDENDSGDYDYGEPFWDFDNNWEFTPANGIYNGSLCSDAAEVAGLCTKELVYVQKSGRLIMSGSFALNISFSPDPIDLRGGRSETVSVTIGDFNNNPMPMGTKIEFTTTNGNIVGNSSFTVPNTNGFGPLVYQVLLEPSENDRTSGLLQVTVTTPLENITTGYVEVIDDN